MQILCCFLLVCAFAGGALYGKKLGMGITAGILALQILLWILMRMILYRKTVLKRMDARFSGKQGIYAGISLAAVFFMAFAVILSRPAYFYDAVYQVEGHVSVMLQHLWKNGGVWTRWDTVSRGNHYRTGEVQLELTISEIPTEPLYLRGFSGGEYAGNGWEEADEERLFEEIAPILNWEEWSYMIGGMYHTMFFVVNQDSVRDNPGAVRELRIRHQNGDYRRIYVPYYGRSKWFWRESGEIREEGYECEYYEQKDMRIDWENQFSALGEAREWYRQLQEASLETVQSVYTQVPEELLPRLTKLTAENPKENLEEITAFIAYTLQSRTSYTLTPGWAPVNQDIVEYFLFENGQGYCQHFAVAATLLYRLYGIPARYASGYLVRPEDFQEREGSWRAEITDEAAHAWVEIFLEDYGWTPVEVTPDAGGQIAALYPGLDSTALKMLTDGFLQDDSFGKSSRYGQEEKEVQQKSEEGYYVIFDVQKYRETYLVAGTCLLCVLLFLPVLMDYGRLRCRQKLERMGCRKVYAVMMDMLHEAGYFTAMEGWEKDFPEKMAQEFPEVGKELLYRQQDIVRRAAYSDWKPDAESEQFVRWVYFLLAEAVTRRMNRYWRLIFRYLKHYG